MDTFRAIILKGNIRNNEKIFVRDDTLSFGNLKSINKYLADNIHLNEESIIEISKNSLNDEELFLTNG